MTDLRTAAQQALEAKQVPLRELLASVPADARLVIHDAEGKGTRSIPVGRLCHEAAAALAEPPKPASLKRGTTGRCTRKVCECEKENLGLECIHLEPVVDGPPLWSGIPKAEPQEPDDPARRCGGPGGDLKCCQPVQEPDDKAASIRWQLCLLAQTEEFSDDVRNQIGRGVWLIDRLRAALAEPQEPVAWMTVRLNVPIQTTARKDVADEWLKWGEVLPLYTAPPQRLPLSEDEIFKIENDIPDDVIGDRAWTIWFARAIERAHGIGGEG